MKEKIKKIGGVLLTILIGLLLLAVGGLVGAGISSGALFGNLFPGISEETEITNVVLEKIISPASDLVTMRYVYRNATPIEKSQMVENWEIPFTTDKFVLVWSGTISAGIDLSEVKFDIDEDDKEITVYLPEVRVISHEVDEKNMETMDITDSVFTEFSMEDYSNAIAELKEETEKDLMEDGEFFKSAEQNAKEVLRGFLENADATKEYEIIFKSVK